MIEHWRTKTVVCLSTAVSALINKKIDWVMNFMSIFENAQKCTQRECVHILVYLNRCVHVNVRVWIADIHVIIMSWIRRKQIWRIKTSRIIDCFIVKCIISYTSIEFMLVDACSPCSLQGQRKCRCLVISEEKAGDAVIVTS